MKHLRDRLEAYEDGVVSVASTVSRFATAAGRGRRRTERGRVRRRQPPGHGGDGCLAAHRAGFAVTHETAREASARRRQLEEATAALAASEAACEDARAKARAAGARRDALERDVRGLREKLGVLKEKSAHGDGLIERVPARRTAARAARRRRLFSARRRRPP